MLELRTRLYGHSPYGVGRTDAIQPDLQGWGSDHPILKQLVEGLRPHLIIEVGSWKGRSAINMARYAKEAGVDVEILCIDTWLGSPEHWLNRDNPNFYPSLRVQNGSPRLYETFLSNVIATGFTEVITPFRVPSETAFHVLSRLGVRAPLIYVDAGHEEDSVRRDIEMFMTLLDDAGVLCLDDFGTWDGVTKAVRSYRSRNPDVEFFARDEKALLSRGGLGRVGLKGETAAAADRPALQVFKPAPAGSRRVLVAIPHFFDAAGDGRYGSTSSQPQLRANQLARAIGNLHQTLGARQSSLSIMEKAALPANEGLRSLIDVVVCTTGTHHLLDRLAPIAGLFRHEETQAEPMMLGFECHRVLRDALGSYDVFAYLEDDLVLHDPLFLDKIAWFTRSMGPDCVLQPHRFETGLGGPVDKLYIDGDLRPGLVATFAVPGSDSPVSCDVFGRPITFERAKNPHSGCFFLSAAQMRAVAERPDFLDRDTRFVGPLESAATLAILKTFRIWKPVPAHAGFLEIEHPGTRYLSLVGRSVASPEVSTK
jgi:hypothetical protein